MKTGQGTWPRSTWLSRERSKALFTFGFLGVRVVPGIRRLRRTSAETLKALRDKVGIKV